MSPYRQPGEAPVYIEECSHCACDGKRPCLFHPVSVAKPDVFGNMLWRLVGFCATLVVIEGLRLVWAMCK